MDAIGSFVPPLPSVLGPNVSAGLNASLGLPLPNKFSLLRDFYSSVFGNFSQSIQLLTNLTDNLVCASVCLCVCVHVCVCEAASSLPP